MESPPRIAERGDKTLPNLGTTVRDLVFERPSAARVFETLGIDYCCGGSQRLAEVCRTVNRSTEEVCAALQKVESSPAEKDWRNASLTELAQHIVDKHQAFPQAEINRVKAPIAKVASAHGKSHPEVAGLQLILEELSAELKAHMMKEDERLFPYSGEMEEAARVNRRPPAPMFGTVQNPVAAVIMDHQAADQAFEKMREITKGYTVPLEGCASYQLLPGFAADLHQHIYLENNILFPRSVELESSFS